MGRQNRNFYRMEFWAPEKSWQELAELSKASGESQSFWMRSFLALGLKTVTHCEYPIENIEEDKNVIDAPQGTEMGSVGGKRPR